MTSPRLITQPDEAATELFRFVVANPDEFPEDVREKILDLLEPGKSISFAVSESAELIYARQKELSKKVISLGAQMAVTASYNRINNFADDNGKRGAAITSALRRASGEKAPVGMSWPDKEQDPEPKVTYLPPVGSDAAGVPAPEPTGTK